MRIYLDSSTLQQLKKPENQGFLSCIVEDRVRNFYFFSEAHSYDLIRDLTDQKLTDMEFMEQIVGDHCWIFDEQIKMRPWTPRQHYDSFDWTPVAANFLEDDESVFALMKPIFQSIPFVVPTGEDLEKIRGTIPESLFAMLTEPATAWDFMVIFTGFTFELTEQQKKFKEMLQYLHSQSHLDYVYAGLGIKGYDGNSITDKQAFLDSFSAIWLKEGENKTRYEMFMNMHQGLEIFGIVKGKPKKQKLMNLINDSRHGYFGGLCDIVVSEDVDFNNKTRVMYALWDIKTRIMNLAEFMDFLEHGKPKPDTIRELMQAASRKDLEVLDVSEEENRMGAMFRLPQVYLGLFDTFTRINDRVEGDYFFFSNSLLNLSKSSLIMEIRRVLHYLLMELGPDHYEKGPLGDKELPAKEWTGRTWAFDGGQIELKLNEKYQLCLAYYFHTEIDEAENA
jgi:hypothetical protein